MGVTAWVRARTHQPAHRRPWPRRRGYGAKPSPDNAVDEQSASVSGDVMVYEDRNADIYGYRISTKLSFPIAVGPREHVSPDIDGDYVVWVDRGDDGTGDQIMAYNLRTGVARQLTTAPSAKQAPRISGNRVVWRDNRSGHIYGRDLASGTGDDYIVAGLGRGGRQRPTADVDLGVWSSLPRAPAEGARPFPIIPC